MTQKNAERLVREAVNAGLTSAARDDLFETRREKCMPSTEWKYLNPEIVSLMKSALGKEFDVFAYACEETGLLRESLIPLVGAARPGLAEDDQRTVISMCASAVVNAANHYNESARHELARRLAFWALKLDPNHVPALHCLQKISKARGDTASVRAYEDAAEMIMEAIKARPVECLSVFERGLLATRKSC